MFARNKGRPSLNYFYIVLFWSKEVDYSTVFWVFPRWGYTYINVYHFEILIYIQTYYIYVSYK